MTKMPKDSKNINLFIEIRLSKKQSAMSLYDSRIHRKAHFQINKKKKDYVFRLEFTFHISYDFWLIWKLLRFSLRTLFLLKTRVYAWMEAEHQCSEGTFPQSPIKPWTCGEDGAGVRKTFSLSHLYFIHIIYLKEKIF